MNNIVRTTFSISFSSHSPILLGKMFMSRFIMLSLGSFLSHSLSLSISLVRFCSLISLSFHAALYLFSVKFLIKFSLELAAFQSRVNNNNQMSNQKREESPLPGLPPSLRPIFLQRSAKWWRAPWLSPWRKTPNDNYEPSTANWFWLCFRDLWLESTYRQLIISILCTGSS